MKHAAAQQQPDLAQQARYTRGQTLGLRGRLGLTSGTGASSAPVACAAWACLSFLRCFLCSSSTPLVLAFSCCSGVSLHSRAKRFQCLQWSLGPPDLLIHHLWMIDRGMQLWEETLPRLAVNAVQWQRRPCNDVWTLGRHCMST